MLRVGFQCTGHQAVFGFHCPITALGLFGLVAGRFDLQAPLLKGGIMIGLKAFFCQEGGLDAGRSNSVEESPGNGFIDLHPANAQAIAASAVGQGARRAIVAWGGTPALIVDPETATAAAASGDALKKCRAFANRTSCLVRSGVGIAGDAALVHGVSLPVDEALVVFVEKNRPLGAGQRADAFFQSSALIYKTLLACFTINIGACIDRICQYLVHAGIGGRDPLNIGKAVGLLREDKILGAEPEPYSANRPHLGELIEDALDGAGDCLAGMEEDVAIFFTPDEANGQPPAQLSAGGFIANSSFEPGADDVEFRLRHGTLQAQKEAVIEEAWMVDAVFIADQSVGDAAQIEEAIPISIVAGDSGDFNREDETDVA